MMDKRGKPVKKSNIDHLRRYYDLEDSDDEQGNQVERGDEVKAKKIKKTSNGIVMIYILSIGLKEYLNKFIF